MYFNNVDFYEIEMVLQLFIRTSSIKFNQNPLSNYGMETFGRIGVKAGKETRPPQYVQAISLRKERTIIGWKLTRNVCI
jgi:hypothetical protein